MPDTRLRERILALAHRHRRYGAGMIYLKLRQAGEQVNHKRVERLYAAARLQVKRRKRKKVPTAVRKPLGRPGAANQVWLMDFVFDPTTEGRAFKTLTVVEDVAHEAVAIVPARHRRKVIGAYFGSPDSAAWLTERYSHYGKEFCGRAMLMWAQLRGVALFLIEPGKPNQKAYIESFNARFRDECLNEHWYTSLHHAQVFIEEWRREYKEKRPNKGVGGLAPSAYARQLAVKLGTNTFDFKSDCY